MPGAESADVATSSTMPSGYAATWSLFTDWCAVTGHRELPADPAAVDAALLGLPSHGWTQGMFGRRDRCLLVLSQIAGVPYRHLATLTVGDVTVADGTVTITARGLAWTLR